MLSRLLESLRRLEYPPSRLELIVVGSNRDPGRAAVETFAGSADFPVRYCLVPEDVDGSASLKRNAGVRAACGAVIAFTDDDCVAHSGWIAAAMPLFRHPEVGGVEGAVDIPKPERPTLTYRGSLRLAQPNGYQTCNMFYRKSVFEECGGFDLSFPYYLEDTDLAYTVMERGYAIPFAAGAVVSHPVQAGRPLKLLTIARAVEHLPYLFVKHQPSKHKLRASMKPLNRSHYLYLALYAAAPLLVLAAPVKGPIVVALALCVLLLVHLAHDFRGVHFTASELALTALSQPLVPILRLFYWIKGLWGVRLGLRKDDRGGKR